MIASNKQAMQQKAVQAALYNWQKNATQQLQATSNSMWLQSCDCMYQIELHSII
jgi:hypothetical protein